MTDSAHPGPLVFDLTGRRALITGGSGGIGMGIAAGMLDAGATVALLARSETVEQSAHSLGGEDRGVFAVRAELADREELRRSFERVVERLGGIDILVNSHGTVAVSSALSHTMEDWDRTMEVNLTASFELCQLAGAIMVAQESGKIINITSMYAFFGGLRVAAYTASKGGLAQLTKALANEWAQHGVNVNAIAPGYVRTQLNEHVWGDPVRSAEIIGRLPIGRWADPVDLAGPAVFLASPASDYLHGVVLPVDGGFLAR